MTESQALQNFRILINSSYRIANRNKENDEILEESYEVLSDLLERTKGDFFLSKRLLDNIDEGNIIQYQNDEERNGFLIRVSISKINEDYKKVLKGEKIE